MTDTGEVAEIEVETFGESEIVEEISEGTDEVEEVAEDFVEDQARSGNLLDEAEVTVSDLDDVTVIWEDNVVVESVIHQEVTLEDDSKVMDDSADKSKDRADRSKDRADRSKDRADRSKKNEQLNG